jgi:hypothetical protein
LERAHAPEPARGALPAAGGPSPLLDPRAAGASLPADPSFVSLTGAPTRWNEPDQGLPVLVHVQRGGDPLGDPERAVDAVLEALAAWTAIPESRLELAAGDTDFAYGALYPGSPSAIFTGTNAVLFGDPYEEISDPIGCGGVLAVGGYWRTAATASTVNGVAFRRALQLYVVLNDGFECFLGDPANLAEVVAHELGHGLGFGHSPAPDSIMRATAHGGRGARLGDDDRDGAHCHYPHAFSVLAPTANDAWPAGSLQTIRWTATAEAGPDAGTVDLAYSPDGGASWLPIAAGTPNDGAHAWTVPPTLSQQARLRLLRPHRASSVPVGYPDACSGASSTGSFRIVAPPRTARPTHRPSPLGRPEPRRAARDTARGAAAP